MAKQWFVGKTKQGQETIAERHLRRQHFETYLPMYVNEWCRFPRLRPFLPSYIFIQLDLTQAWLCVKHTIGMRSLLCVGEAPQSLSGAVIEDLKARERHGVIQLPPEFVCRFKKGERVKIKGTGVEALFGEPLDHKRAEVFITLFGRSNKLVVPFMKLSTAPFAAVA
jgi:transcriptional antiterminator RfaH